MRILRNAGTDRVIDVIKPHLSAGARLDAVSPAFSLFAFEALRAELSRLAGTRLVLPADAGVLGLTGGVEDRAARNQLLMPWLAASCERWLGSHVEVRSATGPVPQGAVVVRDEGGRPQRVAIGPLALTTARQTIRQIKNGDERSRKVKSIWDDKKLNTQNGTQEVGDLLGSGVMSFPKPVALLLDIVQLGSNDGDLVLDFFAGSGTTGHAVLAQNALDGGSRRYILAQLPEPLDSTNKDQKAAADFCHEAGRPPTLAELTKERLRRAGAKVKADNPMFAGDTGFRVFKLASSNIQQWDPNRADLPGSLDAAVEHLKSDRTEADILYELLLKLGLDLCVPIEKREIAGKDVHAVGGGVLLACLAGTITKDDAEPLALGIVEWQAALAPAVETTCVFRDSAFADDVAKSNVAAILEQHGLTNVKSL